MDDDSADSPSVRNVRWERSVESEDFFVDEDRLRGGFFLIAGAAAALLAAFAAGAWSLQRAALAPPFVVGIAHGQVFTGTPAPVSSVRDAEFDAQLSDTVEVLFGRTEKGLPPAIDQFCAAGVIAAMGRSYEDAASKYPAGYVQTLAILESRTIESRPGSRRVLYRGLLSSRSIAAAQTSPIYLDCSFASGPPTPLNVAGWKLLKVDAVGRDAFYRDERERATREALGLPPAPHP